MEDIVVVALGDRMKGYEGLVNQYPKIPPYKPFAVRLDGHTFSKFTTGFKRPFDQLFQTAMISTMNDLMTKFLPVTGYTHSDEITLVFKQACTKEEFETKTNKSTHAFDGKVHKLNSLLAGYCSARFNYHITRLVNQHKDKYTSELVEKINLHEAHFDCRILLFPDEKENDVVNLLLWRSVIDCHRNAVSTYARHLLGHKKVNGLHSGQLIELMEEEKEFNWEKDVPLFYKHGTYAKKELYQTEVIVPKTNEKVMATRQRIVNKCFKINFSEKIYELIMAKNWPDDIKDGYGLDVKDLVMNDDGSLTL